MKRIIGWVLMVGVAMIIVNSLVNYASFQRDTEEYGYFGALARSHADGYSFAPPYTSFEIITMIVGGCGLLLVILDARERRRPRSS